MMDVMQFKYKNLSFSCPKTSYLWYKVNRNGQKIGALRLGDEKNAPPQS
jgi:hypothetical protein